MGSGCTVTQNWVVCNYSEACKSGQYVRRVLALARTFDMINRANVILNNYVVCYVV